jgi:DNA-binding FadR family transcriptional regulator
MPPTEAVRPQKMAALVALRVRQMIVRGELTEGDWLPTEAELMQRFGVSRPTLREAFRLLEADSLIRIRRGPPGGARVQLPGPDAAAPVFGLLLTLTGTTVRDVYEARMVIEPFAAHHLAEHGDDPQHAKLALEARRARAALGDAAAFTAASVHFHQCIVELSGNRTLATVAGMLAEIIGRHTALAFRESRDDPAVIAQRQALAVRAYDRLSALVADRDAVGAQRFWHTHMKAASSYPFQGSAAGMQIIDILG